MLSYAVSLSSLGSFVDEEVLDAFRSCRLTNVEVMFRPDEEEKFRKSMELIRQGVAEKCIRPVSTHLPFYGCGKSWELAADDENIRKDAVYRHSELLRRYADLIGGNVTFHANNGSPLEEHPRQMIQCRKSIEELLPLAEELDFSLNVEFLPRNCVGNSAEELLQIVDGMPEKSVGIIVDVNHVMHRFRELPDIIRQLAPRIKAFHINDYDGVDEMHWFPGQGVIPWHEVMDAIRQLGTGTLLISETLYQLGSKVSHTASPLFALRQTEKSFFFLEKCTALMAEEAVFAIPGN